MKRIKRNEKCPCGSGKKFKKCCITAYSNNRNYILSKQMLVRSIASSPFISVQEKKRQIEEITGGN